jgi:probable FeS assembly SUF system protein SufT
MDKNEPITLIRDCDAVLIPVGDPVMLPKGSTVYITQALGGSLTVYANGNLARIRSEDRDALGLPPEEAPPQHPVVQAGGEFDEDRVWDELRTCYDPEIPINIVDLGLVYDCHSAPLPEGGHRIDVRMTLTAPGCGMGQVLVEDVRDKLERLPGVAEVDVALTFDPPWSYDMMSEAARLEAGLY